MCVGGKYNQVVHPYTGYVNNNDTVIMYYGVLYYIFYSTIHIFPTTYCEKNYKYSLLYQFFFEEKCLVIYFYSSTFETIVNAFNYLADNSTEI